MPAITRDLIMSGQSAAGGWSATQLSVLGVSWPPQSGWIDRIVGNAITREDVVRFIALRPEGISRPSPTAAEPREVA